MKSHLEVPLQHVKGVRPAAEEQAHGIHAPGTYLPGIVVAGTFYQIGKKVFWDVHNPERAIAIAGDWTATGLPATIESAAASGHRAADAVRART